MPAIPNYPHDLTDEHHAWHSPGVHSGFPSRVIRQGLPGSGLEFLSFHRTFITKFHAWYGAQPNANLAGVVAWSGVPQVLKAANIGSLSWASNPALAAVEDRLTNRLSSFSNADEIGLFVESNMHAWLHNASAQVFNEPVLATLHSNESTYFYQLHGLVDEWWRNWETQARGGRVLIADFNGAGPPALVKYWENWGQHPLFNGWHDGDDLQLAGDFMGLGHDQVLFVNSDGGAGRILVADFSAGSPPAQVKYSRVRHQSNVSG